MEYEEILHYVSKEGDVREVKAIYEIRDRIKVYTKMKKITRKCECGKEQEQEEKIP